MKILQRTRRMAKDRWHSTAGFDARNEQVLKRIFAIAQRRGVAPVDPVFDAAKGGLKADARAEMRVPSRLSMRRARHDQSDQLGRFITSPEFQDRANAAVVKAVAALEAKGIKPAFIVRNLKTNLDNH